MYRTSDELCCSVACPFCSCDRKSERISPGGKSSSSNEGCTHASQETRDVVDEFTLRRATKDEEAERSAGMRGGDGRRVRSMTEAKVESTLDGVLGRVHPPVALTCPEIGSLGTPPQD